MRFLAFVLLSITTVIATQVIQNEPVNSIFQPQYLSHIKLESNCEPQSVTNGCICSESGTFEYCIQKTWVFTNETNLDPFEQEHFDATNNTDYFLNKCDKCFWNSDGLTATCEFGYCLPEKVTPDSNLEIYGDSPKTCEPNKTYEFDCVQCTCTSDSKTLDCTAKPCISKYLEDVSSATTESPIGLCQPGKFQNKECSDCKCSEDGFHASCVFKYCIAKAYLRETGKLDGCYLGTNFMLGCQLCYCGRNGAVCEKHCRNGGEPQYNEKGVKRGLN